MSKTQTQKNRNDKTAVADRIFFLDAAGGRVLSANPDGSELKTILVEGSQKTSRTGLVVNMSRQGISSGPTWGTRKRTTAPSSVRIWTVGT